MIPAPNNQERHLRLEKTTGGRQIEFTSDQHWLLGRFSPVFRERHIHTHHTGDFLAVDTSFVGRLNRMARVHRQTAVDYHSRYTWGRPYPQ